MSRSLQPSRNSGRRKRTRSTGSGMPLPVLMYNEEDFRACEKESGEAPEGAAPLHRAREEDRAGPHGPAAPCRRTPANDRRRTERTRKAGQRDQSSGLRPCEAAKAERAIARCRHRPPERGSRSSPTQQKTSGSRKRRSRSTRKPDRADRRVAETGRRTQGRDSDS